MHLITTGGAYISGLQSGRENEWTVNFKRLAYSLYYAMESFTVPQ
jgi:hypothetical protein